MFVKLSWIDTWNCFTDTWKFSVHWNASLGPIWEFSFPTLIFSKLYCYTLSLMSQNLYVGISSCVSVGLQWPMCLFWCTFQNLNKGMWERAWTPLEGWALLNCSSISLLRGRTISYCYGTDFPDYKPLSALVEVYIYCEVNKA